MSAEAKMRQAARNCIMATRRRNKRRDSYWWHQFVKWQCKFMNTRLQGGVGV